MGVLEIRANCLLPLSLPSSPWFPPAFPSAVGEIMKGLLTYEMGFTGGRAEGGRLTPEFPDRLTCDLHGVEIDYTHIEGVLCRDSRADGLGR